MNFPVNTPGDSTVERKWDQYRQSIMAKLHQLDAMWVPPRGTFHPMSRPGFSAVNSGDFFNWEVEVPGGLGIVRIAYSPRIDECVVAMDALEPPDATGYRFSVRAHLGTGYGAQSSACQSYGAKILPAIDAQLSHILSAIEQGKPLGNALRWDEALMLGLTDKNLPMLGGMDALQYLFWIKQWGGDALNAGLDVVSMLVEPEEDPNAWRNAIVQWWNVRHTREMDLVLAIPNGEHATW